MKQPPLKLSDIVLSQWVDFYYKYGQDLDRQFASLQRLPAGSAERKEAYLNYDLDNTIKQYAHYTDTPIDEVMGYDLKDLCRLQGKSFIALKREEVALDVHGVFDWMGEKWQIKPIFNKPVKHLNKIQFEHSQDLALIYSDLQDRRQEAMYELCAAIMRKVGEPYSSELVEQRGERVKQMESLPMHMAMAVKLYTEKSIKIWLQLTNGRSS